MSELPIPNAEFCYILPKRIKSKLMTMNPVVHFELPYENKDRMVEFYTKIFGWKPQMFGPEMGNYVVVETSELDEKTHFPKEPGRINGGLGPKSDNFSYPRIVIAVDNINDSIAKIEQDGGKIIDKPSEIPGIGMYASFMDTEGNRLALIQPKGM